MPFRRVCCCLLLVFARSVSERPLTCWHTYACGLTCSPHTYMQNDIFEGLLTVMGAENKLCFSTMFVVLWNRFIILWEDVILLYMLPFEESVVLSRWEGSYSGSNLRSKWSGCFMDNRWNGEWLQIYWSYSILDKSITTGHYFKAGNVVVQLPYGRSGKNSWVFILQYCEFLLLIFALRNLHFRLHFYIWHL